MLFKETITQASEAEAKYVRHLGGKSDYAHVKIRVTPSPRGTGVRLLPISPDFFPSEFFPG
jgi:translation elongation factor EF-G